MDKLAWQLGWAFFWLATGGGAVIALITAAPNIATWAVQCLIVVGGYSFILAVHYFSEVSRVIRRGRIFLFCLIVVLSIATRYELKGPLGGRHLTTEQKNGLAKIRAKLPAECGMLVYLPVESKEAQIYGKEIQAAFQKYGDRTNIVYAGAMEPKVGIVVGVHSQLTVCGQAGEGAQFQMTQLGMPARIEEIINDSDSVVLVFVGVKPPYD